MAKKGGTKVGNFIRKKRTQIKQWMKDNPDKLKDPSKRSFTDYSISSGDETVYKGKTVQVNENDLRPPPPPPGSGTGDQYATLDPYTEWSASKKKKDEDINIDLTI